MNLWYNPPIKFGEESSSDVILIVGRQEFFVHKKILADKSEYFNAMFNHNFKEAHEKRIEIKDTDPVLFKQLLELIYTGSIDTATSCLHRCRKWEQDQLEKQGLFSKSQEHDLTFTQDFVETFPKLLEMADRFDVTNILEMYLKRPGGRVFIDRHTSGCYVCQRSLEVNEHLSFVDKY